MKRQMILHKCTLLLLVSRRPKEPEAVQWSIYMSHWEYCLLREEIFYAAPSPTAPFRADRAAGWWDTAFCLKVRLWADCLTHHEWLVESLTLPRCFSVVIKLTHQMMVSWFYLFDKNIFVNNWFDSHKAKYSRLRAQWMAHKSIGLHPDQQNTVYTVVSPVKAMYLRYTILWVIILFSMKA